MFCIGKAQSSVDNPQYLHEKHYGHGRKTLTEDMVCFQQAAVAYLKYYKDSQMHLPWKNKQLNQDGDPELIKYEVRLHKYLDRMYDAVQCKLPKYSALTEDGIFKELDKVIACQLALDASTATDPGPQEVVALASNVPLVDIIINIDLFTSHFEDRNKVLRIIKELFNHCTTMKRLFQKHSKLILTVLMRKYDKKCHLYQNALSAASKDASKAPSANKDNRDTNASISENRDEFLAIIVGQLIRLYAKSKSMSVGFCDFTLLARLVQLMQHEQYIIQSDACKTFDTIFKGPRIYLNLERKDQFIDWIDKNAGETKTHDKLNLIFRDMRQSNVYSFKRQSMKLQYEILVLGLKSGIDQINKSKQQQNMSQGDRYDISMYEDKSARQSAKVNQGLYYKFSNYFVDDKENLKDILIQLGNATDDDERIKEELFLLLSFFIITFPNRADKIQNIILKNKNNLIDIINDFHEKAEEEDTKSLMDVLVSKLQEITEI